MPLKVLLHLQYDQHFSSTSMPIIRSSKLYVCYYRLWCVYADCEFNPQSAYAHHILHNQDEYGTMNNLMTLPKPLKNPNLLTPLRTVPHPSPPSERKAHSITISRRPETSVATGYSPRLYTT